MPWSKAANDDGTFRSDEELKALYADAGLDDGKDTIAYCRIGERSSHTWFVLKEILGHEQRQELRRIVDRVRRAARRAGRPRRRAGCRLMCGAIKGGPSLEGVDVANEAVIQGVVTRDGQPVGNAYVRLLDRTGEFTAEVPTSATGQFRFFAGPGEWTLRTLAPKSVSVDNAVTAAKGVVAEVLVAV